ncbi:MAG: hypothetical protein ABI824_01630 [Acidobacteriota bacterium]
MRASALIAVALAASACAADWTEYRVGPMYVISNAGDVAARQRLTEMEQIRFVLAGMLGIGGLVAGGASTAEANLIWPITAVLFDKQSSYAPYASAFASAPFIDGGATNYSAAYADGVVNPEWRRTIVRQLLDANAPLLPGEAAAALADLFSTVRVEAVRIQLGEALPASITGERRRTWAKFHMLATQPAYSGRLRVYLRNLETNDPEVAAQNAFSISATELQRRMNAYADAGKFTSVAIPGKPINARSFYERRLPNSEVQGILAELKNDGRSFPPNSPRGLVAENTRDSLQQAMAANPRWAEPYVKLAALQDRASAKVPFLQKAAELEPLNLGYWETLARTQAIVEMYAEATKSWTAAERAAPNEAERARIRAERKAIEEQRVDAEIEAARRAKEESERDVKRVMAESDARVRAAEQVVNRKAREAGVADSGEAPVPFKEGFPGTRVTGQLLAVECIGRALRLTIQVPKTPPVRLSVAVMPMDASGKPVFTCGPTLPSRHIEVVHDAKPDKQLGTVGVVVCDLAVFDAPTGHPVHVCGFPGAANRALVAAEREYVGANLKDFSHGEAGSLRAGSHLCKEFGGAGGTHVVASPRDGLRLMPLRVGRDQGQDIGYVAPGECLIEGVDGFFGCHVLPFII